MKKIVSLIAFLLVSTISAQENWALIDVNLKNKSDNLNEIIPVVNEETGNFALFFRTKNGLKCYLHDKNQKPLFQPIHITTLPKNFNVFVNHTFSKNEYTLFFKNHSSKKYGSIQVNFKTGKYVVIDDLQLQLKKEKIVETFNDKNQLHILSIKKNSSVCYIRTINFDGSYSKNTIDLSSVSFGKFEGAKILLSNHLMNGFNEKLITKIDYNEPNSLETSSSPNKIFYANNTITMLNNHYDEFTHIININVKNTTFNHKQIKNKWFDKKILKRGSNSYIFKDYFFYINSTPKKLNFAIYNYNSGEIIKELEILKDKPINFKNTPIILEGGDFDNYREFEKTSKFLRKISNPNLGILVYKNDGNYVVTLGSSVQVSNGNYAMFGGALGGALGALLFSTFDSYSKTKSTRIECSFNENFNHVEGKIPLNGFDKINRYLEEKGLKKRPLQTIFKYKGDYIWGSYNKSTMFYRLIKFEM